MKDDNRYSFCPENKPVVFKVLFTEEELKEYYKSIRNNSDISDSYKLKIANTIIDI